MANPPTDRLVKAECRFLWASQQVENVLHFQHVTDSPDPTNMAALAGVLDDSIDTDWRPIMSNTVQFVEVYIEEYAGDVSQSYSMSGGLGVGGVTGDSMPGNCALCLSLRTEFVGRSRRGRFYTIGMAESHQSGGVVTSTYQTAWIAALEALRTAAAVEGWALSVASFFTGGAPRTTGLVTPVTSVITVDAIVDSQRRRLQGRGR